MGRLGSAGNDAEFLSVEEGVGEYVTSHLMTEDRYQ